MEKEVNIEVKVEVSVDRYPGRWENRIKVCPDADLFLLQQRNQPQKKSP